VECRGMVFAVDHPTLFQRRDLIRVMKAIDAETRARLEAEGEGVALDCLEEGQEKQVKAILPFLRVVDTKKGKLRPATMDEVGYHVGDTELGLIVMRLLQPITPGAELARAGITPPKA
jgi:hypothetical protein